MPTIISKLQSKLLVLLSVKVTYKFLILETLQLLEDIASPTKDITEDQTNEVNTQQDCIMKDKTPEKNIVCIPRVY